jgi:hypothetical protein
MNVSTLQLQRLVDGLSRAIGQPVGLDDARFGAIVYSAHCHEVDRARRESILARETPPDVVKYLNELRVADRTEPFRVEARPDLGLRARMCVPVRFGDATIGWLWLINDPDPIDDTMLRLASQCAVDAACELVRERQADSNDRAREAELVRALVSGDSPEVGARDVLDGGLAAASAYAVVVVRPRSVAGASSAMALRLTQAVERVRRAVAPGTLIAHSERGQSTIVTAVDPMMSPADRAQAVIDALGGVPDSFVAGVSAARSQAADLRPAYCEALNAVRVAAMYGRGPVDSWDELGAWGIIARLVGSRQADALVPEAVHRLLADPDAATLVPTLEAYLEHGGDVQNAAKALFVHRASLYKRLRRIEETLGVDLSHGDHRLALHLGIRLLRLAVEEESRAKQDATDVAFAGLAGDVPMPIQR